jgi:ABC-type sulfate transport system permease subunit
LATAVVLVFAAAASVLLHWRLLPLLMWGCLLLWGLVLAAAAALGLAGSVAVASLDLACSVVASAQWLTVLAGALLHRKAWSLLTSSHSRQVASALDYL